MTMTRQHFEAIAGAIKELKGVNLREKVVRALVPVLSTFNTNFNANRFKTACGIPIEEEPLPTTNQLNPLPWYIIERGIPHIFLWPGRGWTEKDMRIIDFICNGTWRDSTPILENTIIVETNLKRISYDLSENQNPGWCMLSNCQDLICQLRRSTILWNFLCCQLTKGPGNAYWNMPPESYYLSIISTDLYGLNFELTQSDRLVDHRHRAYRFYPGSPEVAT